MGGFGCWVIALLLLGVVGAVALYILRFGAVLAVKRDREQHLRILNEARRRAGKPPLTEADLPPEPTPERDELLERIFDFFRGNQRGFEVRPPVERRAETVRDRSDSRQSVPVRALPVIPVDEEGTERVLRAIVLLEEKHRPLSTERLQGLVEKAWGVEFSGEAGAEEFVTFAETEVDGTMRGAGVVTCGGMRFLVNAWDAPYVQEGQDFAEQIREARTQHAILNCRAWRSVDLLGDCDLDAKDLYALLAKVAAELAGNSTLAIYLPEFKWLFPYNETSLRALLSEDPLKSLREAAIEWVPILEENDKELLDAIQTARARFGEFEEAFASRAITGSGKNSPFLVKAEFSDGVNEEHMWVEVTAIETGKVRGYLRSSPVNLQNLVVDEEVSVRKSDISDWIGTLNGKPIGNFTGPVIEKRHRHRQE